MRDVSVEIIGISIVTIGYGINHLADKFFCRESRIIKIIADTCMVITLAYSFYYVLKNLYALGKLA